MDLRLTPEAKRTLQTAANALQRSVSEFVLDSALAKAGEALADRRTFILDADGWKGFIAALDAPPKSLPHLRKLLRKPGFFDPGQKR